MNKQEIQAEYNKLGVQLAEFFINAFILNKDVQDIGNKIISLKSEYDNILKEEKLFNDWKLNNNVTKVDDV